MPFRFAARYGLFTYSQCGDLDPHAVVCLFSGLDAECIIGREDHADEGTHLHAFVDFGRRYQTRDERKFDVDGRHPNVSPSRGTPEKGWDYATKDGDVVGGGLERPAGGEVPQAGNHWAAIADAPSEREFWDLVRVLEPRALLTSFNSLRSYAEWNYRAVDDAYEHPADVSFDLSGVPDIAEWVRDTLSGECVGKLLPPLAKAQVAVPSLCFLFALIFIDRTRSRSLALPFSGGSRSLSLPPSLTC